MPGTRAGTGQPIAVKCFVDRRAGASIYGRREHRIRRTGRTRAYRPKGQWGPGFRTRNVAWEYECSCGYIGWSALEDIERYPMTGPQGPEGSTT